MIHLTLYTTLGCHLCETLEAGLARLAGVEYCLTRVEISEDEALLARFGERIPVLVDAAGEALEGGVSPARLAEWLAARGWLDESAWQAMQGESEATQESGGAVSRRGRRYLG
ncbi:glutaredoxin family protein [Halomonas getboli]|uniref:glutaredoxin family protein n=1 Tax=Halomonas getboli TaxID=2935862 RepID=UPI001FFE6DF5|nr:glutaredoxin family protein [Halomonas getboli]MCK2183653.1 glutaredoxin family protein [Halomonas getboli]